MRPLIVLLGWFIAIPVWGDSFLSGHPCQRQMERQLNQWESDRSWQLYTQDENGQTYLSPTSNVGTWLQLKMSSLRTTIERISDRSYVSVSWHGVACDSPKKISKERIFRTTSAMFDDEDFRKLVKKHQSGIVYSWSPDMPLSIKGIGIIRSAAKKLGLPVFFVNDPNTDRRISQRVMKKLQFSSKPAQSLELIFRRMAGDHYPAILVFSDRRIHGPTLSGLSSERVYIEFISKQLQR